MLNTIKIAMTALTFFCSLLQADADIVKPVSPAKPLYYITYLNQEAAKLDFYFTVEDSYVTLAKMAGTNIMIQDDPTIKTSNTLIKKLQMDQSIYSVLADDKNPHIIHLVDKTLGSLQRYALDQKSSITFSGRLSKLPDEIGQKTHLGVVTKTTFLSNSWMVGDCYTTVSLDAKNSTIRSILTDYIPLKNYYRYLWHGETSVYSDSCLTYISFYGPDPSNNPNPGNTK